MTKFRVHVVDYADTQISNITSEYLWKNEKFAIPFKKSPWGKKDLKNGSVRLSLTRTFCTSVHNPNILYVCP